MNDAPRGDILITMKENGDFVVYNASTMTAVIVPREVVMSFLDRIYLTKKDITRKYNY